MPKVTTSDGKTKKFDYSKQGQQSAANYAQKNPGASIKKVLTNRQLKGKNNGYSS